MKFGHARQLNYFLKLARLLGIRKAQDNFHLADEDEFCRLLVCLRA